MKYYILFISLFVLSLNGVSQIPDYDFNKFTPLQSSGDLPNEIVMSGSDFMSTSRKNLTTDKARNRRAKKRFVLYSSYAIKDIFNSGKVIYNGIIGDYVEKIRLEITKSDPQLTAETKVFIIKSSVVNAFATNQGYIFITTGLLSKLENEAQLAFILCHEMIHYKNKHAIIQYVRNDKIDKGQGAFRKIDIEGKYLLKANHSKDHETEADIEGFDLYAKSGYSLDELNGTFDVLKYSTSPFDSVLFDLQSSLGTEYLVFPDAYTKYKVTATTGIDEDENDIESTHPNLTKRRGDVANKKENYLTGGKVTQRSKFIVSENDFYLVRKLARFDLCHTSLLDRDYHLALYHASSLLKQHPDNTYLSVTMLKALYGLTKYKNANRLDDICPDPKDTDGELQRITNVLYDLKVGELDIIALNYAWRLKTKLNNSNTEVNLITDDIFHGMAKHHPEPSAFSIKPANLHADTTFCAKS